MSPGPSRRWTARSYEPITPADVLRARMLAGWTQEEMARQIEMPTRTYQSYESGEAQGKTPRGMPRAAHLAQRAAVYAVICSRMEGGIPGWPPPDLATLEDLAREAELLARKRRRE